MKGEDDHFGASVVPQGNQLPVFASKREIRGFDARFDRHVAFSYLCTTCDDSAAVSRGSTVVRAR